MVPPLFTQRLDWSAMWYWFHVETCRKGSFIAMPVDRQPWPAEIEWLTIPAAQPAAQKELFA